MRDERRGMSDNRPIDLLEQYCSSSAVPRMFRRRGEHKCYLKAGFPIIRKHRHQENAWFISQEVLRKSDGGQCFEEFAASVEVEFNPLLDGSFALFPWIMS